MLNTDILNTSLNDEIDYEQFFEALGYSVDDRIYLRGFDDKKRSEAARNWEVSFSNFDAIIPTLTTANLENWGIFFIVNGGGQNDNAVKAKKIARAQFIDFDDFPFEEQIRRLNEFPLEPSIIVKTKKSLHCYWLLQDGEIKYFRELQERLIQYFGSDPVIKNESRVMRLYGFEHRKTDDPVLVTLIKFNPELRYTQQQMHEVLPRLEASTGSSSQTSTRAVSKSAERVPVGQGHYYVVKKIGEYLDRIGDNADDQAILALVETDFMSKYEGTIKESIEDFRKKYLKTIATLRARHEAEQKDPGFYSYALKAWKAENPGKDFDTSVTSWDEVREAGRRAKDDGKTFDDGDFSGRRGGRTYPTIPKEERSPEESEAPAVTFKNVNVSEYLTGDGFDKDIEYFRKYKNRKTGFSNIDKYLTLYPGLACLTGATSLGKTSFSVQLADQLIERGETVLYFSLEQLPIELVTKSLARKYYLAGGNNLNNIDIKNGASDDTLISVKKAHAQTARRLNIIECDFTVSADEIVKYVEDYIKANNQIKPIVIVDYLQIISAPFYERMDDRERIDDAVKKLKLLSKENELFVLVISNMARSSYREKIGEDSFKESGLIEYTCDYLFGLQLSVLEDETFFTKKGSHGGEKETLKSEKQKKIDEASEAIPKEVVFKAMKNRNGRKVFRAFFNYRPNFDLFEVDNNSKYDKDSPKSQFSQATSDDDIPFEDV